MDQIQLFNSLLDLFCGFLVCVVLKLYAPITWYYHLKNEELEKRVKLDEMRIRSEQSQIDLDEQIRKEKHARTQACSYWLMHQSDCRLQELGAHLFDEDAEAGFILDEHDLPRASDEPWVELAEIEQL